MYMGTTNDEYKGQVYVYGDDELTSIQGRTTRRRVRGGIPSVQLNRRDS